ncbi:MAG: BlaI/MecI/CopY family transcriptional regulator [Candidatus Ratteibacteria bacterium]|jgi:predicted transcriptional regulator
MARTKDFSKAELEVMKVLWEKRSATVKEVQEELFRKKRWRYTTVLTFISRLYSKGFLEREKTGMAYVYKPTLPEKKAMGKMVDGFIDRVFGGEIAPMMNYLSESKALKPDEISALRKLVAALDKRPPTQ